MARWLDGIEEAAFKPAAGGFIFASPHPWLLGRPRYFLVSDAQKAAIGALLRARAKLVFLVAAVTLLIVLPILMLLLASGGLPRVTPMVTGALFGVLVFLPILVVPHIYLMQRLAPIIRQLPVTDQRFSIRDQFSNVAGAMPRWLLYVGLGCGSLMIVAAGLMLLNGSYLDGPAGRWIGPSLTMASGLIFLCYFLYLARLKKARSTTSR
jgi:hypothetical protein